MMAEKQKAEKLKAPFPYFGGKSQAADLIWTRFGDVKNYVEPFAGSLAVLLARPHWPFVGESSIETVNDIDCYVANFWRALERDPERTAAYADNPVNEADLDARHAWLHGRAASVESIRSDPDWFDARFAGYWAWGLSCWIGDGFCQPSKRGAGKGVNRQLPHLGDAGKGVNRKLPHLGDAGTPGGVEDRRARISAYFAALSDRLRGVRVCCGDWSRVLTPSVTITNGMTGVLLDPPYDVGGVDYGVEINGLSAAVRDWAVAHGGRGDMRIALCGYADEGHAMPDGWECVAWKNRGGYSNRASGKNRGRERIWFSPSCLKNLHRDLFLPAGMK